MLKAWDKIAQQEADRNPFFKKVYESQRRWAADVVTSRRTVHPSYELAADYYWPQQKEWGRERIVRRARRARGVPPSEIVSRQPGDLLQLGRPDHAGRLGVEEPSWAR
jgi:hypothetical protein